jgi:hypothetical protein
MVSFVGGDDICTGWLMRLGTVDGGHRAIKYTRLGGVKQEIFAEGMAHITTPYLRITDGI